VSVVLDKQISLMQRFVVRPTGKDGLSDSNPKDSYTMGVNDGYEPWPKDPKDDFEKQKRIEWLRGEIDRIRYVISNHEYKRNEADQKIYALGNELYSLRTELEQVNYNISGVNGYVRDLENKKLYIKQQLYNGPPNERDYWRNELDRVNDEISRAHNKLQELNWRRNDINASIRDKNSQREVAIREKHYYEAEIQRERYNLKDREDELRRLQGW